MVCPACLTDPRDLREAPSVCPVCGAHLTAGESVTSIADDIVEDVVEGVVREAAPDGEPLQSAGAVQSLTVVRPVERQVSLLQRAARLPALAWQRPAVRAAVRTGASAVALSLAARAARHWLRPGAPSIPSAPRRARAESALPALMDAFHERDLARRPDDQRDQGIVVSETFVYIRRVIRR